MPPSTFRTCWYTAFAQKKACIGSCLEDKCFIHQKKLIQQKAFEETKAASAGYFGGSVPKLLKGGLRDGDVEMEDPAYEGCYFIKANSVQKPGVVEENLNPILDQSEFYSGCYGRASITFYPYNAQGSKGIACGLNNVQKLEDGEKLGGGTTAAADFAV